MPHTAHRRETLAAFGAATLGLVAIFTGEAIGMNTANKMLRGEMVSVGASRAASSFEGER